VRRSTSCSGISAVSTPFEDPTKSEMRARCEIAIDQAGHQVVGVIKVQLPDGATIRGGLLGDLQSVDGDGVRYCYYLRPGQDAALPKWLANLARVAHVVSGTKLYVVASEQFLPSFERSCRAAGAGLLVLTDDNLFSHELDFDQTLPEELERDFQERLDALRREMETKLSLNQDIMKERFNQIGDLTREMPDDVAEKYRQNVERDHRLWGEWGESTSARLDAALASRNSADLDTLKQAIEAGPDLAVDEADDE
jgi:hypothetical protein